MVALGNSAAINRYVFPAGKRFLPRKYVAKRLDGYSTEDRAVAFNFLHQMDTEFDFSRFPRGIPGTIDLLFEHGQVIIFQKAGTVIGLVGYLIGEPKQEYRDSSIGYIYLAILLPEYRKKVSLARLLLKSIVYEMIRDHISTIRFKALQNDTYLNGLYSKLGIIIAVEPNCEGITCNLYSANINAWMSRFLHPKLSISFPLKSFMVNEYYHQTQIIRNENAHKKHLRKKN